MWLRTDGVFGVTPTDQQQPKVFVASKAYGLASIAVPHALASSMAAKVNGSRSPEDYLQIGDKSFAGYLDYTAIPVPVDREEQYRRTAMLVAHKGHIQYCMEHWPELKTLVEHVATSLGVGPERCKQVHFTQQRSPQSRFTWHQDHGDLKRQNAVGPEVPPIGAGGFPHAGDCSDNHPVSLLGNTGDRKRTRQY